MDINDLVKYEQLFPLNLVHPTTEEPLGITFQIRSAGCVETKAVLRRHYDENMQRATQRKSVTSASAERQEAEKAASYIHSWDWGDQDWKGEVPEYSVAKATEILQAAPWLYAQVAEAATSISNFSKPSQNA